MLRRLQYAGYRDFITLKSASIKAGTLSRFDLFVMTDTVPKHITAKDRRSPDRTRVNQACGR